VSLVFALAAAALFGTGAYLVLNRDLVRVVLGVVIISQASVLTIIAAGITRGEAPIDVTPGERVSDPLSEAMALTAIVIGLAVTALLLTLVLRVVDAYHVRDLGEVSDEEAQEEERLERAEAAEHAAEEEAAR
jgi:multicomponent Na+:H+ antiporter subunit C